MKARIVRPEFWTDSTVGPMADSIRLFYIGLWCMADDGGFLEWDLAAIGAAIMPFRSLGSRSKVAAQAAEALLKAGRIRVLDCGRHAVIPSLERHRIRGGNQSRRVADQHRACHVRPRPSVVGSDSVSDSVSDSDSGAAASPPPGLSPEGSEVWAALGEQFGARRRPS